MIRNIHQELISWYQTKKKKPLILRGARQVGKSTAVRQLAEKQKLKLYEINLERHINLDKVFATFNIENIENELQAILREKITEEKSLLFLDEIQATPHAIAALRYFYEDKPNLSVIAAGSLLDFTLADHFFSMPVGRIEQKHIYPFTFDEFLLAHGQDYYLEQLQEFQFKKKWPEKMHQDLIKHVFNFFMIGGMPEAVLRSCEKSKEKNYSWRQVQESIVFNYKDDFNKYAKRRDINLLHQLFDRIPKFIAKTAQYSKILPQERTETIKRNIQLLTSARIVLETFHTHGTGIPLASEVSQKKFKLFWLDIGLLNCLLGIEPTFRMTQDETSIQGNLAEQFVAQHLINYHGNTSPPQLFYWLRNGKTNNAEVDFLIQQDQKIIPIEVKSGSTGSLRSLQQFIAERKSRLAVRFSLHPPMIEKMQDGRLLTLPIYMIGQLKRLLSLC